MEGIKCFQHCSTEYNIFCFQIPQYCPLCGRGLSDTGFKIPPYFIPCPFVRSENTKCSLLIKPTVGDFITDFTNESNLHIGVTDSSGYVYEFDESGVSVGDKTWTCCLKVELVNRIEEFGLNWDESLTKFKDGRLWKAVHYDESRHNCFDFVVGFLRYVGLDRVYSCLIDRSFFCKEIILPHTERAGKYISLYRNIVTNGYVIKAAV